MNNSSEIFQHEVQRKLGRCILRLQQYERLMKAMVAGMEVKGPLEHLQTVRARQEAGVSDKSLGTLVRLFTSGHLAPATSKREAKPSETSFGGQSADVASASMRFTISMSPERHAQTKEGLAELVALRNDLVHHLIERFDISDEEGCRAATTHLESCYEKIDGHCERLKSWATGLAEDQALMSSFIQTKAFEDALVHGISHDGTVCWPRATIVECLREAETVCRIDGWTSLSAAIALISTENRDQIPRRYGCKTWRQILRKSGLFELRSVTDPTGKRRQTWYRSPTGQR